MSDWADWFAWRPVRTWDGRLLWMCWVERRRLEYGGWRGPWQYREFAP